MRKQGQCQQKQQQPVKVLSALVAVSFILLVAIGQHGRDTREQRFVTPSPSNRLIPSFRSRFPNNRPEIIWVAGGHSRPVRAVAYSPDGQMLATGSSDLTAKIWRISDGMTLHRLTGHTLDVNTVAFSPDGQLLATGEQSGRAGGSSSKIRIWRVADGSLVRAINLPGVHS